MRALIADDDRVTTAILVAALDLAGAESDAVRRSRSQTVILKRGSNVKYARRSIARSSPHGSKRSKGAWPRPTR